MFTLTLTSSTVITSSYLILPNLVSSRLPQVRHNVAMVNVFADDVGTTHPLVRQASPMVCELDEGDALFLPRG